MTSRNDMDRPATVLSASLGVVLIAISILLFLFVGGGAAASTYDVAWSEDVGASRTSSLSANGQPVTIPVTLTDAIPSNATVTITCTDGAVAPLQNPSSVSWALYEGNGTTALASGTACVPNGQKVALEPHPDVGSIQADSEDDAETQAMGDEARTVTYRLVVTVTSGGGALPGVPAAAFSGTAELEVQDWLATANTPGQEATPR